jgi:hypothetical protein
VVLFVGAAAWSKDRGEQRGPVFMAPDFQFSQIDTICIAPPIDLRADKTEPLYLSASGGKAPHLLGERPITADVAVANWFNHLGYPTVGCNSVDPLDDLRAPSDAWLSKLDFGQSRWLFILAVEYFSTPYGKSEALFGSQTNRSHAVVSGYLFAKQAAGGKLVWRDKVVGTDYDPMGGSMMGRKSGVKGVESEQAIAIGVKILLSKFETRNKDIRLPDKTYLEPFDVNCSALWPALNDVLKNSGKYDIIQIDDPDKMAIYSMGVKSEHRMDDAILRPNDNGCSMEITPAPSPRAMGPSDVKSLSQHVHAVLSK